jgi:hypothetical protein
MQVLSLTQEQINALPGPEREAIQQLVRFLLCVHLRGVALLIGGDSGTNSWAVSHHEKNARVFAFGCTCLDMHLYFCH